jgi:holo-[acyl-carrier protein] synthase
MGGQVIAAIGIDLVDIDRIRAAHTRWGDRFLNRVYTSHEIAYCFKKGKNYRSLAARFAAKEATMKALGTGWKRGVRWVDLEVMRKPGSAPEMVLHGRSAELAAGRRFLVSLTHTDTQAIAVVIAQSPPSTT